MCFLITHMPINTHTLTPKYALSLLGVVSGIFKLFFVLLKAVTGDFPGGPVAKTPCFQMQGPQVQYLLRELNWVPHARAKSSLL